MNAFSDTPSSSFETPINRGHDTPKTNRDDKFDDLSSKHGDDEGDDEKQSVTSTNRSMNLSLKNSNNLTLMCLEKVRDLRLDQYLAINTSEDNISFEQIMEDTQKKERAKVHQAWLYAQQALTHSVGSLTLFIQYTNPYSLFTCRAVEMQSFINYQFHRLKNKQEQIIPTILSSGRIL